MAGAPQEDGAEEKTDHSGRDDRLREKQSQKHNSFGCVQGKRLG